MPVLGRFLRRFLVFSLLGSLSLIAPEHARSGPGNPVQAAVWTTVKDSVDPIRLQALGGENQKFSAMLGRLNAKERTAVMGTLSGLEGTYARDADSLELVGSAYNDLGDYAKAEEIGKRIQALNPESPAGYLLQSSALRSQGSFAKAGELAKMAAEREKAFWVGRSAAKFQGRQERPQRDGFAPRGRFDSPKVSRKPKKRGMRRGNASKGGFAGNRNAERGATQMIEREILDRVLGMIEKSPRGKSILASVVGPGADPNLREVERHGIEIARSFFGASEITRISKIPKTPFLSIVLGPEFFELGDAEGAAFLAGELANVLLVRSISGRSNTLEMFNRIANRTLVARDLGFDPRRVDRDSPVWAWQLVVERQISDEIYANIRFITCRNPI